MTDHRLLVPILNSYTLNAINNPRLQHLKEKIIGYVFTAEWHKGKSLAIPDALSRAPMDKPSPKDVLFGEQSAAALNGGTVPAGDIVIDGICTAARKDCVHKTTGVLNQRFLHVP